MQRGGGINGLCDFNLPVCPGPLVEWGGACRAVLVAQPGGARHVVIGHHRGLHWLQGLVGGVAPGCRKTTKLKRKYLQIHSRKGQTVRGTTHRQRSGTLQITLKTLIKPAAHSHPRVPRPAMGGLGGFCVGGLVLEIVPPRPAALFPCC